MGTMYQHRYGLQVPVVPLGILWVLAPTGTNASGTRELNKGLPQNTAVFRFYVIRHAHKDTGDVPSNTQYNQIGDNRSFGCLITVIRDINRKSEF